MTSQQAIDPRDITIPDREPAEALADQADRAPHNDGLMVPEEHNEPIDDNRREDLSRSQPPKLEWWHAEKFYWAMPEGNGRPYLRVYDEFINYVIEKTPAALDRGYTMAANPDSSEHDLVAGIRESIGDAITSFKAIDDAEERAFERFLQDRALRNAVYAATTQFELVNWAVKAQSRQQDASQHPNYAQKEARRDKFAAAAGVYRALLLHNAPTISLDAKACTRAAWNVTLTAARMATAEYLNTSEEEQTATDSAATRAIAEAF